MPVKKKVVKKAPVKKKAPAKKAAASKKPVTKTPAKKTAVKKPTAKVPAKKAVATKKSVAKAPTKKVAVKKTPVKKTSVAKKAPVKKAEPVKKIEPAKKAVAVKKNVEKKVVEKPAVKEVSKKNIEKPVEETKKTINKNPAKSSNTESKPTPVIKRHKPSPIDSIPLIESYNEKEGEDYMNLAHRQHFRQLLNNWKYELMQEVDRTVGYMKDEAANFPDPADRAAQEEEFNLELRTRDRERKLIKKIDEALQRIDDNDYGYCEACGIEIGTRRLEARPTATLCIDCKTVDEIREKQLLA